jgi:enamine deaminase RidA (YjgF/YER057c/UK114 family)
MQHVVYTQVYLDNISRYDEMDRVFADYFGKTPPARAALGVARIPHFATPDQRGRHSRFVREAPDLSSQFQLPAIATTGNSH